MSLSFAEGAFRDWVMAWADGWMDAGDAVSLGLMRVPVRAWCGRGRGRFFSDFCHYHHPCIPFCFSPLSLCFRSFPDLHTNQDE
jgi:hypothetical protein